MTSLFKKNDEFNQFMKLSNAIVKNVLDTEENVIFSPLSFIHLLGLVYYAAGDEQKEEIESVLKVKKAFNPDFISFIQKCTSDSLVNANALAISPAFIKEVKQQYIDFAKKKFKANVFKTKDVNEINEWIRTITKGMIEKGVDEDPFDILLINAMSFLCDWEKRYKDVERDYFTNVNGRKRRCWMMESEENIYVENEEFEGIMKPYKDSRYSFMAFLPKKNNSSSVTMETINSLFDSRTSQKVITKMPKVKIESEIDLKKVLKELGMNKLFSSSYTLSGITENPETMITKSVQKAYIKINEKGTEAAAVSYSNLFGGGIAEPIKNVSFDHPYYFSIMDHELKIPVFIGHVNTINHANNYFD